ncbi:MerR family transcriptional regulator [Arthrobacter sp. 179]|uniref:MerR family transcriptional regulator n=1 Tax=Arthrobacter sp. 179 TaxID=3457734 RepID=UPI0040343135
MRHSISQVAKIAGVTSRTLRHYDAIGLLTPSEVGANGYRWYGRAELRRLQRILLLRQMGLGLVEIGQVISGQSSEISALRFQRDQILSERDRLDAVIETIERTITDLTGNDVMDPEDFFRGLHQDRLRLRNHLSAVHGPGVEATFSSAAAATSSWEVADYEQAATKSRELLHRMAALFHQSVPPCAGPAQELVGEHYNSMGRFWQPDASSYEALADLYLSDNQQRAWISKIDPVLPPWLAAAMKTYAKQLPHRAPTRKSDEHRCRELNY